MPGIWIKTSAMEVHRLKLDVCGIILVEPWFVLSRLSRIIVIQDTCVRLLPESQWTLHALNNFLSAVSMMNIKVNDCNFLYLLSVNVLKICRCDSHVVNVAESIRLLLVTNVLLECLTKDSGVMPWRSDRTECIVYLSV